MTVPEKKTARLIYADSERCADMLYAVGIMLPDPFIWMQIEDTPFVIVSDLEAGRVKAALEPLSRVYTLKEISRQYGQEGQGSFPPEKIIASIARHAGVSRIDVPEDFPLGLARKLQDTGVTLSVVSPFFPQRARKTPAEVEHIGAAVRIAESGMNEALTVLQAAEIEDDGGLGWEGVRLTSEMLRGVINAKIAREGGTGAHTIVASGSDSGFPHEEGHGEIHAGEPVVIDIFPRANHSGYYGDLTRTVVKGPPPPVVKRAFAAVAEANTAAMAQIKPGMSIACVHESAAAILENHGFQTVTPAGGTPSGFIHSLGHGLGLEIHEAPSVNKTSDAVFQAGNVVTVEPGLYYPAWGGIRIEDVVAVTDDGCERLTQIPVFLSVA